MRKASKLQDIHKSQVMGFVNMRKRNESNMAILESIRVIMKSNENDAEKTPITIEGTV